MFNQGINVQRTIDNVELKPKFFCASAGEYFHYLIVKNFLYAVLNHL
jgi:hypothetical protein